MTAKPTTSKPATPGAAKHIVRLLGSDTWIAADPACRYVQGAAEAFAEQLWRANPSDGESREFVIEVKQVSSERVFTCYVRVDLIPDFVTIDVAEAEDVTDQVEEAA